MVTQWNPHIIHNLKCQILCQHLSQYLCKYHVPICVQWNDLYPYIAILLFLNVLVLHNHTKTHTLIFHSLNCSFEIPKNTSLFIGISSVFSFFSFLLLKSFQFKILQYNNLALILNNSFFFLLYKFDISMFS